MPDKERDMTFWDHLGELRGTLLRVLATVLLAAVGFFLIMRWFFDNVILWPCRPDFPLYGMLSFLKGDGDWLPDMTDTAFSISLINVKLGTQLMTHFSASFYLAIVFTFPFIIYQLWRFVAPGLYPNEKRGARKAFLFGNIMFYLGTALGYFVVYPLALRFLSEYQLSDKIQNMLTLDSYMDAFYTTLLSMGLVFELPLLAWMLGKAGIITRRFFSRNRKYAVFCLLVLSGIITPTSDIFTLFIVFVPLYALWEFSALLVPKGEKEPDNAGDDSSAGPAKT